MVSYTAMDKVPSRFKYIRAYNIEPVRKALEQNPDLWCQRGERVMAPNSPHSGTKDIWVRYNDVDRWMREGGRLSDEHIPIWYPAWQALRQSVGPIIFNLMARLEGEMLGGVLITRIPPGCRVEKHQDRGWHVDYYRKFYTSIESQPGAYFFSGDERLCPRPGETFEFDNRLEHWVENISERDRITLITCIHTDMI